MAFENYWNTYSIPRFLFRRYTSERVSAIGDPYQVPAISNVWREAPWGSYFRSLPLRFPFDISNIIQQNPQAMPIDAQGLYTRWSSALSRNPFNPTSPYDEYLEQKRTALERLRGTKETPPPLPSPEVIEQIRQRAQRIIERMRQYG